MSRGAIDTHEQPDVRGSDDHVPRNADASRALREHACRSSNGDCRSSNGDCRRNRSHNRFDKSRPVRSRPCTAKIQCLAQLWRSSSRLASSRHNLGATNYRNYRPHWRGLSKHFARLFRPRIISGPSVSRQSVERLSQHLRRPHRQPHFVLAAWASINANIRVCIARRGLGASALHFLSTAAIRRLTVFGRRQVFKNSHRSPQPT